MNKKISILITGSNGQLGTEFRMLENKFPNHQFLFTTKENLAIDREADIAPFFLKHTFDYCINCAAYTAVDKAETEKGKAYLINATAAGYLAKACAHYGVKLFHISTDYVFNGTGNEPYKETDPVNPLNYYGFTKLEGEKLVQQFHQQSIILRTSWVYSPYGNNFVKTMIRLMQQKESIAVVGDQWGAPTYAADLAEAIMHILSSGKFTAGIYHYSNRGMISWFEFAQKIKDYISSSCIVNPITTKEYPTPARRPHYSVFNLSKIQEVFGIQIPEWQDALKRCIHLMQA